MDVINKILDLQRRGMSDQEIVTQLGNEGISPKEIRDSISQATVKNAVYQEENFDQSPNQGMSPSITESGQEEQQMTQQPENQQSDQSQAQTYYTPTPQSYSPEQGYYQQQSPGDTEVITEIAEQVSSEKINELKKKIGDITGFKSEMKDKIEDLDDRLKRIENTLDKIQQSIIGKIGEFGENASMIQQDLGNIHQTMSKMMDPLMDNYKELKRIANKE